ncbi:unnamed protein product, partial [Ectocarpus sp. 8 AP-2014]
SSSRGRRLAPAGSWGASPVSSSSSPVFSSSVSGLWLSCRRPTISMRACESQSVGGLANLAVRCCPPLSRLEDAAASRGAIVAAAVTADRALLRRDALLRVRS